MSYLGELRRNVRPLVSASLGAGTSLPLIAYTNSAFAPHIVAHFGWTRSQFALGGLAMLSSLLFLPFIGRFADRLGVKRVAFLGTLLVPLCFVGYATMQGSFGFYLFLSSAVLAVGAMTSPLVYTRLIAENFVKAQGLALTIVNCTPAVIAMALVPVLNWGIETYGFRAAYLANGAFILVIGMAAVLLVPREKPLPDPAVVGEPILHRPAREDFGVILKSRLFWLIFVAMFLCLIGTPLHSSQMNLMLLDNGLTADTAARIVSVYAFGTILGRLGCGLALDRYATPIVSAASMFLPAIGLLMLASDVDTVLVITAAMLLVGIYVGAESDLISFLVARYFKLRIYNSTLSLLYVCSFVSSAVGAIAISYTLGAFDHFAPFLYVAAGTVVVGSVMFLFMPRSPDFAKIG